MEISAQFIPSDWNRPIRIEDHMAGEGRKKAKSLHFIYTFTFRSGFADNQQPTEKKMKI